MREIDWRRMAEPQVDGYDTEQALWLAAHETSAQRPQPYLRRPAEGAPTLFDGRVAVRNRASGGLEGPRYAPAPLDHPHLSLAADLLRSWPQIAAQFPALVDTIQPWLDVSAAPEFWLQVPGSSSHSLETEFGVIMATVDSPIGLAQAMVHEMAHQKLRALGVSLHAASRLVVNDPAALFVSPIVTERRRPMTAVLHAQYSFMHVTTLDIAIYEATIDPELTRQALFLLARNTPRMEAGRAEIAANIQTDAPGAAFLAGFTIWSDRVLERANAILDENDLGMPDLGP